MSTKYAWLVNISAVLRTKAIVCCLLPGVINHINFQGIYSFVAGSVAQSHQYVFEAGCEYH